MFYLYRKGYKQGSLKKKAPVRSILQGSPRRGSSARRPPPAGAWLYPNPAGDTLHPPARTGPAPRQRASGSGCGGTRQPLPKAGTLRRPLRVGI